jgi:hypothetical protein
MTTEQDLLSYYRGRYTDRSQEVSAVDDAVTSASGPSETTALELVTE